jgi:hypothetical protein
MAYAHALCGHEYVIVEDFDKAVSSSDIVFTHTIYLQQQD